MMEQQSPMQEALERVRTAELREALTDRSFDDREQMSAAMLPARPRPSLVRSWRWRLVAILLSAVGVAFALPIGSEDAARMATQDPHTGGSKITVRNADINSQHVADPGVLKASQRLAQLAHSTKTSMVLASQFPEESAVALAGLSARAAVDAIVAELDLGIAEYQDVVLIGASRECSLPLGKRVTMKGSGLSVFEFAKQLHARCGVSLVVADDLPGTIAVDVTEVYWRDLLEHVARQLNVRVAGCGSVLVLRKLRRWEPRGRSMSLDGNEFDNMDVLESISLVAGQMVVAPGLKGRGAERIPAIAYNASTLGLLAAMAAARGQDYSPDYDALLYRVAAVPALLMQPVVSMTVERVSLKVLLAELVPRIDPLSIEVDQQADGSQATSSATASSVADPSSAAVSLLLRSAPALHVITAIAEASAHVVVRSEDGFVLKPIK